MKAMQMTASVSIDGKLIAKLPPGIPPGEHRVVLVIDDGLVSSKVRNAKPPLKLNVLRWEAWPAESTFRRKDIYGDDGR